MERLESRFEEEFLKRIIEFLNYNELRVKYSVLIQPNLSEFIADPNFKNRQADFIIMRGRYPYMIIEVKAPTNSLSNNKGILQNADFELELIGADYFILTNLNEIIVVDSLNKQTSRPRNFSEIFNYFGKELSEEEINNYRAKIAETIQRILQEPDLIEYLSSNKRKGLENLLRSDTLLKYIQYNIEGRFFHFFSNPQLGFDDFENRLFQDLLEPVPEENVCRYTSFETMYQMLNNKSYRMGSDIAMNDRGEIDYVDKYIGLFYKPLQSLSLSEMQLLNNSYISSCTISEKQDDLTMYRLYAEDSKGVCLCFNVKNIAPSKHMLLKKISYAKAKGNHPELEFIKKIVTRINSVYHLRFRFLYLDIWKHFFKPHDYEIEKEVRLLYLDNLSPTPHKGWVITNPDKILSKYVLFSLNAPDFPLSLTKIILGPNFPESLLNKRQLEVFLNEQNLQLVKVENSRIESYRKS
jgi:hypothetical protein